MFRFVTEERRKAMPIVFETVAYDGKIKGLTEVQRLHAVFFHPEIEGEQEKMKEVLKNPEIVVRGATEDTKICYYCIILQKK